MVMAQQQARKDNFNIIACEEALKVLSEDEYFQDLPANWHSIIRKILEKLTPKAQSARFSEQLNTLTDTPDNSSLPDAIKHLIAALNNSAASPYSASDKKDIELEFSRTYTPRALNSKMPRQQPVKSCRGEEERPEERMRPGWVPRLVN